MKFLSALLTEASGSVGGFTVFKSAYNQLTMRARTNPVNPKTTRQSQMRGSFSDAAVSWRSLTPAERAQWNTYAEGLIYTGALGNYSIPGRLVFISNYGTSDYLINRGFSPGPLSPAPPVLPGFLAVSLLSIGDPSPPATGYQISAYNPNPEAIILYVERSRPFDATRNTFKGPFLSETLDSVAIESETSGVLQYDGLIEDLVYFNKIRAVSESAPFRMSAQSILRAIAVDVPADAVSSTPNAVKKDTSKRTKKKAA